MTESLPPCHPGSLEAERRLFLRDEQRRTEFKLPPEPHCLCEHDFPPVLPAPSDAEMAAAHQRAIERFGHLRTIPTPSREALDAEMDRLVDQHKHLLEEDKG